MSKTNIIVHLVFATKQRKNTILPVTRKPLYNYLFGILKRNDCHVYEINGIGNHVHILFELHPTVALSSLVKELKTASNAWLKQADEYRVFESWCSGYYAGSISPSHLNACEDYIKNQDSHHHGKDFIEEMKVMAEKYNLTYYPKDWD